MWLIYVPDLGKNFLFVKRLEISNVKIVFENGFVKFVYRDVGIVLGLGRRNALYEIAFHLLNWECLNIENINNLLRKCHGRYSHIDFTCLEKLIKSNIVDNNDYYSY